MRRQRWGSGSTRGQTPTTITITYGAGGLAAEALNGKSNVSGNDGKRQATTHAQENRHNMRIRRAYAVSWHYYAIRASIAAVKAGQFRQDSSGSRIFIYSAACLSSLPSLPLSTYFYSVIPVISLSLSA